MEEMCMEGQRSAMYISFVVQTQAGVSLPGIPFFFFLYLFYCVFVWIILQLIMSEYGQKNHSNRDKGRYLYE